MLLSAPSTSQCGAVTAAARCAGKACIVRVGARAPHTRGLGESLVRGGPARPPGCFSSTGRISSSRCSSSSSSRRSVRASAAAQEPSTAQTAQKYILKSGLVDYYEVLQVRVHPLGPPRP